MAQYVYAPARELQEIAQDYLPQIWGSDAWFSRFFDMDFQDTAQLIWEQKDNFTGVLQPRTLDGGFNKVDREGRNQFIVSPGYYGDQKVLWEEYLTINRRIGTFGEVIDVEKEQQGDLTHLIQRAYNRVRLMMWSLYLNGTYSITGAGGIKYYGDTFAFQTYTATTPWSTTATATPLADMRNAQLLQRGHSIRFDSSSYLVVNQKTMNNLLSNTNDNDLGGRRVYNVSGPVPLTTTQLNAILLEQGLPQIVAYDEGYYPDPVGGVQQSFVPFIPDGQGVLFGARMNGEKVGNFTFTRNPNNLAPGANRNLNFGPGGRGASELYVDFTWEKNPIRGITTVGMNGAPVVWYPSAVVRFTNL